MGHLPQLQTVLNLLMPKERALGMQYEHGYSKTSTYQSMTAGYAGLVSKKEIKTVVLEKVLLSLNHAFQARNVMSPNLWSVTQLKNVKYLPSVQAVIKLLQEGKVNDNDMKALCSAIGQYFCTPILKESQGMAKTYEDLSKF